LADGNGAAGVAGLAPGSGAVGVAGLPLSGAAGEKPVPPVELGAELEGSAEAGRAGVSGMVKPARRESARVKPVAQPPIGAADVAADGATGGHAGLGPVASGASAVVLAPRGRWSAVGAAETGAGVAGAEAGAAGDAAGVAEAGAAGDPAEAEGAVSAELEGTDAGDVGAAAEDVGAGADGPAAGDVGLGAGDGIGVVSGAACAPRRTAGFAS
jgi:hypothetical protein